MRRLIVLTSMFALLLAGPALAEEVTATDGDGNTFGDTQGFRIDFDATPAASAVWDPSLLSGKTYNLESVSVRSSNTNATPVYLGVYTGFSGGVFSGFLGTSDNAVNFSAVTSGAWAEFTFTGISVTVDDVAGEGSGLLYFLFQTGTAERTATETTRSIHRNNGFATDPVITGWLANIIAWGGAVADRAPEYKAKLTPPAGLAAVPDPADGAVVDLTTLSALSWQFNTEPNMVSISGDVVFGAEPNMLLNTTYANVTSPMDLASNGIYLDYDTTYYWRVDSHIVWDSNEITGNWQDTKEGLVWTFTTLPEDKVPAVTASSFLTAMEYLPDVLTATVNDFGEDDVTVVNWEVLVQAAAKRILNRTATADLTALAEITSDPSLLQDWIGSDTYNTGNESANPLKLTLKGLPSGTYSWTSYHHDAQNQHGTFDATVSDASGTATTTGIAITSANTTPVSVFTTSIVSDGVNDVVVEFKLHPHNANITIGFMVINGFELTSEAGSLKIDFGAAAVAGDPGVAASPLMAGYEAYEATTQDAATFTEKSYSAFGTTVSLQPTWGGIATVTKITSDPKLATQQATFDTDRAGTYSVQISATDGAPNTGSVVQTVTVGANACAAAQLSTSWPGFNAADLNQDCLVNIQDFAAFAGQWLDDRNLVN